MRCTSFGSFGSNWLPLCCCWHGWRRRVSPHARRCAGSPLLPRISRTAVPGTPALIVLITIIIRLQWLAVACRFNGNYSMHSFIHYDALFFILHSLISSWRAFDARAGRGYTSGHEPSSARPAVRASASLDSRAVIGIASARNGTKK